MPIFVSLLMNLIVAWTSFLITYRILKFTNFIDSALALFILYFAQIVTTELILGVLGILKLENVILLNLAILLAIWFVSRNNEYNFNGPGLTQILNNKVALFIAAIILGFGLVKFFINLVNPPFGWDDLNYHFTFPVEWLKHGNLNNPITVFDDPSPTYYPINGSLFFFWLMSPLKNVFLADLGQVPFFVLAFLAAYGLGRKVGLIKEISFYAAGLFLITPNLFKQLQIAYVDTMVAALFLVCLNYLFLLNEEFSWKNVLVFSMSLGLLLGTKTIALPYSLILFLPFIYLSLAGCTLLKAKERLYLFIIAIFIISALGGFSYIRNFIETGNPLYPLNFNFLGRNIFKGVMDADVYRVHFTLKDYSLAKLLFHEGLGVQTVIFILPGIFLALPIAFIKTRKLLNFNLMYFLILPFFLYFVYRYVIPLPNTRYLYPLLGTGIIIGFYAAKIIDIPKKPLNTLVVICGLASIAELAKRRELIVSIILTFLLFVLLPYLIKYFQHNSLIKKPLFIALLSISIVFILIFMERDYIRNEFIRYIKMEGYSGFWPDATRAWNWLNSNTTADNIAYAGRPVPFPLYGTNFKNNVYYVSVNKTEPAKLHYFSKGYYRWNYDFLSLHRNLEAEGNYRFEADYFTWLDNLKKKDINYLFVYSLHQTKEIEFPKEDRWAKVNPAKFIPVFANQTVHIYKISKDISPNLSSPYLNNNKLIPNMGWVNSPK